MGVKYDPLLGQLRVTDVVADATTTSKGIIQLAGDLGGTAASPAVKNLQRIFNVKDYGAIGDGITNDQPAIVAAINAANTAGGGTVYFPVGTYALFNPINLSGKTNIRIKGESRKSVIIIPQSSLTNFSFNYMFYGDSTSTDITIEGFLFNGQFSSYTSPPASKGGGINPGKRWTVVDNEIKDFNYFGLFLGTGSSSTKILRNRFNGPGSGNDHIGGGGAADTEIAGNIFEANIAGNMFDNTGGMYCYIHHNTNYSPTRGIIVEAVQYVDVHDNYFVGAGNIIVQSDINYNPTTVTNSRYILIKNNTLNGGYINYTVHTHATKTVSIGGDLQVLGNTVLGPQAYGILVQGGGNDNTRWGSNYSVQHNSVKDANSANTSTANTGQGICAPSGINILQGMNVLVSDNVIVDTRATPQQIYGIQIGQTSGPSAANEPNYVSVLNNHIAGFVTAKTNRVSSTYTSTYYEVTDGITLGAVYTDNTKVLKAGDTMTGQLLINNGVSGSVTTGLYLKNTTTTGGGMAIDFENAGTAGVYARINSLRTATTNSPTDLVFSTSNTGSASLAESFRIKSDGTLVAKNKLTSLTDPTNAQDATTKNYVDTADALKANSASPSFTGTPTAPTATSTTNTTQIATTAFVQGLLATLVNGAPGTLDQLNELAAAIGNDPTFASDIMASLAGKQSILTPQTAYTANFTAIANTINQASGTITATLPSSTTNQWIVVKKTDAIGSTITVSYTLGGATTSLPLTVQNQAKMFYADGSGGWIAINGDLPLDQLRLIFGQLAAANIWTGVNTFTASSPTGSITTNDITVKPNAGRSTSASMFLDNGTNIYEFFNNSSSQFGIYGNGEPFAIDWAASTYHQIQLASDRTYSRMPIDMNTSNKIINLANPTNAQDAATKTYVDTSVIDPLPLIIALG